jgi:single-strand DNA-binding protein
VRAPAPVPAGSKTKGDVLLVDGRLRQHTWERDGQRHSRLAVVADQVSFGPNTKGGAGASASAEGEEKDDLPF